MASSNGTHKERQKMSGRERRRLLRARASNSFFLFNRCFTWIMSLSEAVFIQDLINLSQLKNIESETIDGRDFFKCTTGFLENADIGWSEDKQREYFRSLGNSEKDTAKRPKGKGFLLTIKRGQDGVRWVHIDIEAIEDALDEWELNHLGDRSRGIPRDRSRGIPRLKKEGTNVPSKQEKKNAASGNDVSDSPSSSNGGNTSRFKIDPVKNGNGRTPTPHTFSTNGHVERAPQPKEILARLFYQGLDKASLLSGDPPNVETWFPFAQKLIEHVKRRERLTDEQAFVHLRRFIKEYVNLLAADTPFIKQSYCFRTLLNNYPYIKKFMEARRKRLEDSNEIDAEAGDSVEITKDGDTIVYRRKRAGE